MDSAQQKFTTKLLKIDGIKRYMLIRNDGFIVTHNVEDANPEDMSSMMLFSGINCDRLKEDFFYKICNFLHCHSFNT